MAVSKTTPEWNPCRYLIIFLPLLLMPSFILGWTMKKCNFAGKAMQVQDNIFAQRCAIYANATSLALCSNITNMEVDLSDVPITIDILCASGANKVIQGGNFAKFRQLMYLTIKMPINEILPEAFKGLENLHSLSISFLGNSKCNNLSLPENAFANMRALRDFTLEGFYLTKNTRIQLPKFTVLHTLSLPKNCISDLFHIFHNFQEVISIHTLDVRQNMIQKIEDSLLKEMIRIPNITELNLSGNPLKNIKHNAFARFNFRLLNLDFTHLDLTDLLSSGIKKLESLSLMFACKHASSKIKLLCSIAERLQLKNFYIPNNEVRVINSTELLDCHSLETFNLNHNRLTAVDSNILSKLTELKFLYLSYNRLDIDLCPEWYKNKFISGLQLLHFSNSNVSVLRSRQFSCMPHLQELALNDNGIQFIEESAFWGLKDLQILDLTSNKLTKLRIDSFSGLSNLKMFYLKDNELNRLNFRVFKDQTQLEIMSFSSVVSIYITVLDLLPSLQKLNMENKGNYLGININNTLNSALHTLVLNVSNLRIYAKCSHSFFSNLRELKIRNNEEFISCAESGSPMQHFKSLEKLQYHFNGKPFMNKLNFSNMHNLIHLDVQNLATAVKNLELNPMDFFQKLYKLQIFKLVNSGFKYLTPNLFKDMKSLKLLIIENGLILAVDPGIQGSLDHANFLYFYDMTFQCDCVSSWFVNWAIKQKQIFVSTIETAICLQVNKQFNFVTFVEKNCNQNIEFIFFLVTFTSISVFLILTLMYTIFNSSILQLIYIFQVWLHKLKGKKNCPIKYDYDAFVSYCSLDQDWVIQYLIPNLEEKGPPFFKLCLHNRDFQVGKDIVENIMDSIYKSRKTICLISHSYLKSEWCSLEMRMATYKILEEKNDDLLLLFLERISRHQLSSYHRLAKMVKKKTYIDWPKEKNEQIAFWEKLRLTIMDANPNKEMQ